MISITQLAIAGFLAALVAYFFRTPQANGNKDNSLTIFIVAFIVCITAVVVFSDNNNDPMKFVRTGEPGF